MKMIKIECWINPFNPYSLIAKSNLDKALAHLQLSTVEVEWKWFTDPIEQSFNSEGADSWSIQNYYATSFDQSEVWVSLLFEDFNRQLLGSDYSIDLEKIALPHALQYSQYLKIAETLGQASEFVDFLMLEFWQNNKELTESTVTAFFTEEAIISESVLELVKDDFLLTEELGISEAPMMIVNEEIGLCGIQPIEHLVEVISMAQSDQ